jgi:hypothetical protein
MSITEAPVLLTIASGGHWIPVPRSTLLAAVRTANAIDTRPSTFDRAPRFWVPVKRYRVAQEAGKVHVTSEGKTLYTSDTHAEAWAWLSAGGVL